jgi:glycosyltransferase involved in cell wall biosynthesis
MLNYDFSVVICTQNRGKELAQTLSSLVKTDLPQFKTEVLIIDNGSTSANQTIHRGLAKDRPLFHYHFTPVSGLSHARNLGLQFAQGQFVCFFDDDAIIHPGWFEAAACFFHHHPHAGAIGGKIHLQGDQDFMDRLNPIQKLMLSAFDLGDEVQELHYNNYPRGTHIAFRKTALEQVEGFNTKLGRMGPHLLSYEEIELCYRLEQCGYAIYYVPQLEVTHLIRSERLDSQWFTKRAFWQGRSEAIFDHLHRERSYRWKKCFSIMVESLRGRSRHPEKGYLWQTFLLLLQNLRIHTFEAGILNYLY